MSLAAPPRTALSQRRSNRELLLLLLAVVTVLVAYGLLGLSQDPDQLPPDLYAYGIALLGVAVGCHVVTRRFAPGGDPVLLPVALLLNGLGLVMMRRLDFAFDLREGGPQFLAPAQAMWTLVAVGAFCGVLVVLRDHRELDNYRYIIGFAALVLLLLPLLPVIGREINGARLWLRIGGLSIQPAELAKLGLVVFFASYLAEKRALLAATPNKLGPLRVPPARAIGPVLIAWAAAMLVLVAQNDFGLSLLFFGVFVVTLYVATQRVAYVAIAATMFIGGALVAYQLFSHVQARLGVWMNVWDQYEGAGYQIAQSMFALGSGGMLGVGLGQGRPDLIPFVQTDFVFSAFGEELGLLGATAILLCFFLLISRGFSIAVRSRDDFGSLLATGLTVIFALQVFVIIGGVTHLIPLTGLTLPFVSYGGSSLLANYVLVALLIRVSANNAAERQEVEV